jgi:hypothetical protein
MERSPGSGRPFWKKLKVSQTQTLIVFIHFGHLGKYTDRYTAPFSSRDIPAA